MGGEGPAALGSVRVRAGQLPLGRDPARLDQFDPEPQRRRSMIVSLIAQDPTVLVDGSAIRARVSIPAELTRPGPWGERFHVVDYDATSRELTPPATLAVDLIELCTDAELRTNPAVRAHNVFAIATRTLATFESSLGRRLGWSFGGHQLYLVPAAFAEANAFYDPDAGAILFGYFAAPRADASDSSSVVYTSLSHDVVAHETTHAVLDGMRRRFEEPSLADQTAFHEALADIVALLSVFSLPETVGRLLPGDTQARLIGSNEAGREALARSVLLGLAEEVGAASQAHGGGALRRSVTLAAKPTWLDDPRYQEAHARGEILVAAVTRALLSIWTDRISALHERGQPLNRDRVAEEGAKAAAHLLTMCIRAIDYLPPLDLTFADFLAAVIASDIEVVPDDDHRYRSSVRASFARFGIRAAEPRRVAAVGRRAAFSYGSVHAADLRERRDEVFRWIWENASLLGIPTDYYLSVESVDPCVRVGPDGFVVHEVVITYIQLLDGTLATLNQVATRHGATLSIPLGTDPSTEAQLQGGGTIVFDEFGRIKYHHAKPLFDWGRQSRRLEYLINRGIAARGGKIGSSTGLGIGQRFAVLHTDAEFEGEAW